MGTICSGAKDQPTGVELNKKNSKAISTSMGTTSTKLSDAEAWAHVNRLWAEKKLKKEESMSF